MNTSAARGVIGWVEWPKLGRKLVGSEAGPIDRRGIRKTRSTWVQNSHCLQAQNAIAGFFSSSTKKIVDVRQHHSKQRAAILALEKPAGGISVAPFPATLCEGTVEAKIPLSWGISQTKNSLFHTRQSIGAQRKARFISSNSNVLDEELTGS